MEKKKKKQTHKVMSKRRNRSPTETLDSHPIQFSYFCDKICYLVFMKSKCKRDVNNISFP